MKKRGLADWLSLLLHGVVGLGFLLFALQFLMLGLIRRGPHGEVRDRPWFVPRRIEDAAEVGGRIYILYRDRPGPVSLGHLHPLARPRFRRPPPGGGELSLPLPAPV